MKISGIHIPFKEAEAPLAVARSMASNLLANKNKSGAHI